MRAGAATAVSESAVTAARPVVLRWHREVLIVAVFYGVYTSIRNLFGSASVSPERAYANARQMIGLEDALGLFHEEQIQRWFLDWSLFLRICNIFYGTFHFAVTIAVLVFLFSRRPHCYRLARNTLAFTTGLALIGFSLYPLMPPRLLNVCGPYGACATEYGFVDTLEKVGGLWSFNSGTMQSISNQYAAMPSLHFAWSTWCWWAIRPHVRSRPLAVVVGVYPAFTLFTIVVTANHYWIDAVGGLVVLGVGYLCARRFTALMQRQSSRRLHTILTDR